MVTPSICFVKSVPCLFTCSVKIISGKKLCHRHKPDRWMLYQFPKWRGVFKTLTYVNICWKDWVDRTEALKPASETTFRRHLNKCIFKIWKTKRIKINLLCSIDIVATLPSHGQLPSTRVCRKMLSTGMQPSPQQEPSSTSSVLWELWPSPMLGTM